MIYQLDLCPFLLDMMSLEDKTIISDIFTFKCWPFIFSYEILKYAHLVFAEDLVYKKIKEFAVTLANLFFPGTDPTPLFSHETIYADFAKDQT